ncbi:hypothetical protein M0813_07218 [Anaeramoeba flamelloides]|uniref:Ubiquitin-like domain-containing protein n=1 Tax=Anaeramoeba flamelloides TaxID=1746091 RepID=A0ABQ8XD77_9EUKA|nr:hypothetical protein M0813_07218 [Anaeramoeba flamelloides]
MDCYSAFGKLIKLEFKNQTSVINLKKKLSSIIGINSERLILVSNSSNELNDLKFLALNSFNNENLYFFDKNRLQFNNFWSYRTSNLRNDLQQRNYHLNNTSSEPKILAMSYLQHSKECQMIGKELFEQQQNSLSSIKILMSIAQKELKKIEEQNNNEKSFINSKKEVIENSNKKLDNYLKNITQSKSNNIFQETIKLCTQRINIKASEIIRDISISKNKNNKQKYKIIIEKIKNEQKKITETIPKIIDELNDLLQQVYGICNIVLQLIFELEKHIHPKLQNQSEKVETDLITKNILLAMGTHLGSKKTDEKKIEEETKTKQKNESKEPLIKKNLQLEQTNNELTKTLKMKNAQYDKLQKQYNLEMIQIDQKNRLIEKLKEKKKKRKMAEEELSKKLDQIHTVFLQQNRLTEMYIEAIADIVITFDGKQKRQEIMNQMKNNSYPLQSIVSDLKKKISLLKK